MPRIAVDKREEYAEGRREQILNAALQVFSNRGFAETTMDEIAAASGLGKGTLYCYFPSKEVLLEKLVARYVLLPEVPELVAAIQESPPAVGFGAGNRSMEALEREGGFWAALWFARCTATPNAHDW